MILQSIHILQMIAERTFGDQNCEHGPT